MSQAARSLLILLAATSVAHAEAKQPVGSDMPLPRFIRVPGAAAPTNQNASSRIVYVKRCVTGCDVHEAPVDDSRTGASSIAGGNGATITIGQFTQPNQVWTDLMACVRTTFAPFDIQVTDVKPADGTPHFLNVVGGKPTDLMNSQIGPGTGGVAPFDCGEIPNAISYTFDVYGPNAEHLCWTVAQEVAHAFGLEHQFLAKDPMTYLQGSLPKRFRDVDAPCGELEQQAGCGCGGSTQNTYRHIVGMFGFGVPTPPEITVKYPLETKPTQPGFTAVIKAVDDVRVDKVEVYIDGTLAGMSMTPFGDDNFEVETADVGAGPHTMEIKAYDVQQVVQTQTVAFTQGPPCTPDSVCTGDDVCVDGVCVPGPDVPGGLGTKCGADTECLSHRCADGGEEFKHCVAGCNLGNAESCPSDFTCVAAGAEGVCWYTPSGGCCDAGQGPQGAVLLTLGLGMLLLRRRRRPTSATHSRCCAARHSRALR